MTVNVPRVSWVWLCEKAFLFSILIWIRYRFAFIAGRAGCVLAVLLFRPSLAGFPPAAKCAAADNLEGGLNADACSSTAVLAISVHQPGCFYIPVDSGLSVCCACALSMRALAVWTVLSANPLLCGYSGLLVICSKSHARAWVFELLEAITGSFVAD